VAKTKQRLSAVLAPDARQDIRRLLHFSEEKLGKAAALRYETLLIQAARDIAADPVRPGAKQRPDLPEGILTYHLAFSRDRATGNKVKEPRHFLAYRVIGSRLEIVRMLHDSSDLSRHLPASYRESE
jgi:toxin ParE1/3/4